MSTENNYFDATLTNATPALVFTATANATVTIIAGQATNTGNLASVLQAHLVPSGDVVSITNQVIVNKPVNKLDSEHLDELFMQAMKQGDQLYMNLSDVGTVNVRVSFVETV